MFVFTMFTRLPPTASALAFAAEQVVNSGFFMLFSPLKINKCQTINELKPTTWLFKDPQK